MKADRDDDGPVWTLDLRDAELWVLAAYEPSE